LRPWLLIPLSALIAASSAAETSSPTTLSFDTALRRALSANATVARAEAEVEAADAQRRTALSYLFPRLQATGGLIRNSKEVSFGGGDFARVILPLNDWNLRLTISQPIFAGLRDLRTYRQAKEGIRGAEQGARAVEDQILLKVAVDYLTVVQGDALVAVEEQSLDLAERRLKQAQDFFEAGEVTQVDVLRAESSVKAAERRVALAHREREVAAGQLRVDLDLDGEIRVAEPSPDLPPRAPESDLIAQAEKTRPAVRQARIALRVAELEVSKQKGAYLPVVTADAGYVRQKTAFPAEEYGYAALRVSVPIWQSGEVAARVAGARVRQRQAQLALDEVERSVREDVRRAILDAETAARTLSLSEEQLAATEAEYQQVFELYQSQEATSLDLQATETTLADARRTVVNSRLARILAELGIHFAAGDLKSVVLKEAQP